MVQVGYGVHMECGRYKKDQKRAKKFNHSQSEEETKKPVTTRITGSLSTVGVI